MGTMVKINQYISFSPNNGIIVAPGAASMAPSDLHAAICLASKHIDEPILVDACCGAIGPLAGISDIEFADFLLVIRNENAKSVTAQAKQIHTKIRRSAFSASRSELVLKMIDAGRLYVCSNEHCRSSEDLTVDHIVPLSRGGSDETSNLQFLCRSCNSAKGDRAEQGAV